MKTSTEIRSEIDAFEAEFRAPLIPAGTPNRKALQDQARSECESRTRRPENVETRRALYAALARAQRSEKAKAAAARRKADPSERNKAHAAKHLRRMGFRRETTSGSGSAYYTLASIRVRISDHDVPLTQEREHAATNGGWSWATHGWTIRTDASPIDVLRDLVHVRRDARNHGAI